MANLTSDEQDTIRLARSLIRDAAMNWARDELVASPEDVCAKLSEIIREEYDFESGITIIASFDHSKQNLFEDTVLRKDLDGKLYLMNRQSTGWGSSSYIIPSVNTLLSTHNVRLGKWTRDNFSEYCPVIRILPDETKTR